MIQVSDLRVSRSSQVICAVDTFQVSGGDHVAVTGTNGSGKSTLLRVLAALETSYTGSVTVHAERRDVVLVHQTPFMLRGTVLENVCYGLRARGISRGEAREAAERVMTTLDIAHLGHRTRRQLSGGEVRRMALARAAVLRPRVLLLDEPFAELDELGVEAASRLLRDLLDTTVVLTSPVALDPGLARTALRLPGAVPTP